MQRVDVSLLSSAPSAVDRNQIAESWHDHFQSKKPRAVNSSMF